MRRILFALPLAGLSFNALGADLPASARAPVAPAAPLFTWTGFYGGLFAGYGTLDGATRPACITAAGVPGGTGCAVRAALRPPADDFVAGSEFGYNYQPTPGSGVVVGAAIDYAFTRIRGYESQTASFPRIGGGAYPGGIYHVGQRLDDLATGRLKVGYALDRLLVYGTAGVAGGTVRIDTNTTVGGVPFDGRAGAIRTGYVAGGGVEYAFSDRLSAKVEGLYYDLGSRTVLGRDVFGVSGFRFGSRVETSGFQIRAGLNERFGDALPFFGIVDALRAPESDAPLPASIWSYETGMRYFYSSGTHRYTLGSPTTPGQVNSRLTYRGFGAHAGESFVRLDHNPTGLFLKGFLGSGYVRSGRLHDEDFPPALTPYSNTVSPIRDGDIAYAAIDAGYDVLRGETYRLGAFVGFQHYEELANGFGCRQVAGGGVCAGAGAVPGRVKVLTEDAHWNALRVGLAGEVRFDRFRVALEGAYLPVVDLTGNDRHWLRPDINPLPQRGTGDGYFLEGLVSYDLTRRVSVGVGGRYWRMNAGNGRIQFPFAGLPASPTKFETDRYGAFAQISYKVADFGLSPLIAK